MSTVVSIGTYLPPWGTDPSRECGPDEDAVTLAVAAGRHALAAGASPRVRRVVLVTRRPPLVEGGNGAALLAGLGLPASVEVVEQLGGGPATLEALATAVDDTLVIGADTGKDAGAAAALTASGGTSIERLGSVTRSLPVRTRDLDGDVHDYDDPRLLRERGALRSIGMLPLDDEQPVAVTGLPAREAASVSAPDAPAAPTAGASAPIFAIAALIDAGRTGPVLAVEQATTALARLGSGDIAIRRDERAPQPLPRLRHHDGPELAIALAGYERAFDPKLRLEAAQCTNCGTLSYPPRVRCLECGSEEPTDVVALPRDAAVYTTTTIRVPVPSLSTPYSLAIVELGDSEVRLLVHVTGAPPGAVAIGDRGELVFRLVATRAGVPDYGYAFLLREFEASTEEVA